MLLASTSVEPYGGDVVFSLAMLVAHASLND
jgi:hypothetical protein